MVGLDGLMGVAKFRDGECFRHEVKRNIRRVELAAYAMYGGIKNFSMIERQAHPRYLFVGAEPLNVVVERVWLSWELVG